MPHSPGKLFMVGCSRSGTTLLQAIVSAHPAIVSFPETQFLSCIIGQTEERLFGNPGGYKQRLKSRIQRYMLGIGLAPQPRSGARSLARFADNIEDQAFQRLSFGQQLTVKSQFKRLLEVLERQSLQRSASHWLIKTPNNIAYMDVIEQHIPDAKFIHIVRPGEDVVASLYDAAQKYPDTAWNTTFYQGKLERLATNWCRAIRYSADCANNNNHFIVFYEDLIKNPEKVAEQLFAFIGVEENTGCISDFSNQVESVKTTKEAWKTNMGSQIQSRNKYDEIFNEDEKKTLMNILKEIELEKLFQRLPNN